jgi:hypothetical protein
VAGLVHRLEDPALIGAERATTLQNEGGAARAFG